MSAIYKLVVVHDFLSFKRGDFILDQSIVKPILDVDNKEWHVYEGSVRKVSLTQDEILLIASQEMKQQEIASDVSFSTSTEANNVVNLSSVSENQETEF